MSRRSIVKQGKIRRGRRLLREAQELLWEGFDAYCSYPFRPLTINGSEDRGGTT